jgi:hypothetical protein
MINEYGKIVPKWQLNTTWLAFLPPLNLIEPAIHKWEKHGTRHSQV